LAVYFITIATGQRRGGLGIHAFDDDDKDGDDDNEGEHDD
jgi:hypothetical protein